MKDHNVMIDIETLSTRNDACVISIGAAAFTSDEGVTDTAEWKIDLKQLHGHIDPQTVSWWMQQSDAAKQATFTPSGRVTPYAAALGLREFIGLYGRDDALVWANSPTFDLVILRNWWRTMPAKFQGAAVPTVADQSFPVHYRMERDCRTLFALARELGIDFSECWAGGTAHSAVDDAANQARAVTKIMRELRASSKTTVAV